MNIRAACVALILLAAIVGMLGAVPLREHSEAVHTRENDAVTLLFVGDMFFDRSIRETAEREGYNFLLSCVKEQFMSYDAVVGNLEGPITTRPSVSVGSIVGTPENFTFTFAPDVAKLLASHNVLLVSLGNNHILNMGEAGLQETKQHLSLAGVTYFGGVLGDEPIYRTIINGESFSFVGFNEFGGAPAEDVARSVEGEKRSGRIVIVFAHWGNEYEDAPVRVKAWARQFAEAGATFIVGAHPHVVGAHERIGETEVYYSLGNFLFDQFFSEEVSHGLAIAGTFKGGQLISLREIETTMGRDRRVCFTEYPQEEESHFE